MKTIILSLLFITFPFSLVLGQEDEPHLLEVVLDGKIGFSDNNGKIVIPIKYDSYSGLSEEGTAVKFGAKVIDEYGHTEGGKWGFIDEYGNEFISFKYDYAISFNEGLASVKKNGKYGYINSKDELVIDFQFDLAHPFYQGYALVEIDGKWGMIDKKGKIILPLKYERLLRVDDCGCFKIGKILDKNYIYNSEDTYGLINLQGDTILDVMYNRIGSFNNGLAAVNTKNTGGFINKKGEVVIPFEYESVSDFSEGYAAVSKYVFQEPLSQSSLIKRFAQLDSLEWAVEDLNNLDEEQLKKHPTYLEYQKAEKAIPREKELDAYINTKNELITEFAFDSANEFQGGVAKVRFSKSGDEVDYESISKKLDAGGKLAYNDYWHGSTLIDTLGNVLLEGLQGIERQEDGYIINTTEQGSGVLDSNFNQIIPLKYETVNYLENNDLFFVRENGIGKIINLQGRVIVESEKIHYVSPMLIKDRLFVVYIIGQEGSRKIYKAGMMDLEGNWLLDPKYDRVGWQGADYYDWR